MSLPLDKRYLIEIQNNLHNFKQIGNSTWNFRCPICGDSRTNKSKARGYIYANPEEDFLRYKCHNCSASMYFRTFLKLIDPTLYKKYIVESMQADGVYKDYREREEKKREQILDIFRAKTTVYHMHVDEKLDGLTRLDKLPLEHSCVKYIESRQIPKLMYSFLYYTDDFASYVNKLLPNKIRSKTKEARLIIPYFDKDGRMYALQGRSLNPFSGLRYITVKFDESMPKIYGIDRVDTQKPILCVEGPIDSMFLPNCLAVSGSSYSSEFLQKVKHNVTIVPDNERFNKEVVHSLENAINGGYKVCLWRKGLDFKDINEAILKGITQEELLKIIKECSVSGLSGKIRLKMWKSGKI